MSDRVLAIGLDAASQLNHFGYAIGEIVDGVAHVEMAGTLSDKNEPITLIAKRLATASRAIVAIDAPLGWPASFSAEISGHEAGSLLKPNKDSLFRRRTEVRVRELTDKQPLEVAADKIARASHSALEILAKLRTLSGNPLPLAWAPTADGCSVIEVYPAATILGHGASCKSYKGPDGIEARRSIANALQTAAPNIADFSDTGSDAFDACICIVAALDFIGGHCDAPGKDEFEVAKKEGWIWFRRQGNKGGLA